MISEDRSNGAVLSLSRRQARFVAGVLLTVGLSFVVARIQAAGTWASETSLPSAIQEVSVAAYNGQVFVIGGSLNQVRSNETRVFDPATHLWSSKAPYPGTARDHMGLAVVGSFLYLMGGLTANPQPSVNTVQRYDPATETWTALAPLPLARAAMGVAVLNGKIYAAGGLRGGVAVNDFTSYDPSTNTWTTLPSLPTARDHLTAAALNGRIYAIGGRNTSGCAPLTTVEVYDPATNAWSAGAAMINGHAGHATGVANNRLQVFGGELNPVDCGIIRTSEEFDPVANTWTALPDMVTPRHGTGGATIGTSVYVPAGATAPGDAASSVHERFDAIVSSSPLPSGWTSQDIGAVGAAGSASYSNGTFTVQGSGADIWGAADAFQFVWQPLAGDGQITARVAGLQNTNTFAKAGVMIRQDLTAGSAHVILDVKAGGGTEFMTRAAAGGATTYLAGSAAAAPAWIRLARTGSTVTAYGSSNGTSWTAIGSTTTSLASSVYVGLVVCSHVAGSLTTASFDTVSVTGTTTAGTPPTVSLTSPVTGATYTAPASIQLTAAASDSDGTVARVDFFANGTQIGTASTSPYGFAWTNVSAGSYSLTAVATDNSGLQTTSSAVSVTVSGASGGSLPSPWQQQDIGTTGAAGSASVSGSTYTVNGSGADIWGTADAFHYVYQSLNGDGSVTARVTGVQNTNALAKAGVMIRGALTAGAQHALLDLKAGGGTEFMTRATSGGTTAYLAGTSNAAPVWLRLTRAGSTITAAVSTNGSSWITVGTTTLTLPTTAYVGLAVCSHVAGTLAAGTFDSVQVAGGATGGNVPPTISITSPVAGATFQAPATVAITVNAADTDGTVARVDFFANSTQIGTASASPFSFAWTNVAAGSYSLTAVATDNAGGSTTSAAVAISVSGTGGTGGLPGPWASQDVGTVGVAGSASYSSGTFTVKGAGADIWSAADAFQFVYQPLNGDGQITARVTAVQNTNIYAKAGVMIRETLSASSANALLSLKPNGAGFEFIQRSSTGASSAYVTGAGASPPFWLRLARSGSTITASVSSDGATWSVAGTVTISMASSVYVGLAVCSHDTTQLNTSTFDNVTVGSVTTPPPSSVSFNSKAIAVADTASGTAVGIPGFYGPTSLAVGPDGRLYASIVSGKLFAMTIDPTKLAAAGQVAVTGVQEFDDIYLKPSLTCNINNDPFNCQQLSATGSGRQVTGIAIDPASTPSRIVLYVSNSGLGKSTTDITLDTYGGTITRLVLEPDPANAGKQKVTSNQDLVVGLPRSREAHSINGMSIGSDGWLYLSVGGNTNAGQPSTFFANLPEYFLSASVVRLNLAALVGVALPIDVHNVKSSADLTPLNGLFELYATGYRNGYDLLWHSNGRLYLNGNAANQSQGNTPGSSDGCSTPSISPGDQPDTLNLVTAGAYGGHPNPARGQCVWGDGTIYSPRLQPLAAFVAPLTKYVNGGSSDGVAEYKSDAFNGALRGNLISATYAGDQTVRRVVLSGDGLSVQQVLSLGTFVQPLDVWVDVSGNVFIAEYGANRVTVLTPTVLPTCPVPNSDPKTTDSDGDGYTDYDEQANGTDVCSPASKPPDADGDFVSDLLDTDDDNDGIADTQDQLWLDAQNGAATTLPVALEWNPSDPAYGFVANSGFTGSQISSKAAVDAASGHAIVRDGIHPGDAGGHLTLWTYSGTAEGSANNQVNALQIGFDSTSNFRVYTRIVQPFTGVTPAVGHVGGIFFGPNQDNYARLALVGTANGGKALQFAVETGGTFAVQAALDLSAVTINNLDIFLVGNAAAHSISAYYDLNLSGTLTPVGTAVAVPAAWFSNNSGTAANTSLAGLMVSNGAAPQMAFGFDFFRIDRNTTTPPPSGPPTAPSNPSPANAATGVSLTSAMSWSASSNATSYDVAFGTSNPPPPVASALTSTTYQPASALAASTTYFWKVTANGPGGSTAGPVWSFTTGTSTTPSGNIVIYASDVAASALHGWTTAADATSPNGVKLVTADNGASNTNAPLASPSQYVDVTFNAPAGTPYTIWLRLKALNNNKFNDSVWVQFSDARLNGSPIYPLNSTSGLLVNLATSSAASSLQNWGWQNGAYWLSQAVTVSFATSGTHTMRIQIREDGVQFDQVVLSSTTYLSSAPGPVSNDNTIVPKQ